MGQNFATAIAKAFGSRAPATGPFGYGQLGGAGDMWTSQRRGQDYAATYQGNVGIGSNTTGRTISNGLATTYTGLCLSNPAASGVNLSVMRVSGMIAVAPAGVLGLALITGWSAAGVVTHTTAAVAYNAIIGGATPNIGNTLVAKVDEACTLVGTSANAPQWLGPLASSVASTNEVSFDRRVDGGIIIPPGGYLAVGSLLAAGPTNGFLGAFQWEEIPLVAGV